MRLYHYSAGPCEPANEICLKETDPFPRNEYVIIDLCGSILNINDGLCGYGTMMGWDKAMTEVAFYERAYLFTIDPVPLVLI